MGSPKRGSSSLRFSLKARRKGVVFCVPCLQRGMWDLMD